MCAGFAIRTHRLRAIHHDRRASVASSSVFSRGPCDGPTVAVEPLQPEQEVVMKRWTHYASIAMVLGAMTFRAGNAEAEDRAGDSSVSPPASPTEKDQVLLAGKVDH